MEGTSSKHGATVHVNHKDMMVLRHVRSGHFLVVSALPVLSMTAPLK